MGVIGEEEITYWVDEGGGVDGRAPDVALVLGVWTLGR